MAEEPPGAGGNPLLRGLFGVLQSGAEQGVGTAQIWSDLRSAAGTWQAQAQGLPQPYDPEAVDTAGRAILSAQGINGATVSSFRGIAGQWLGAKQRLQATAQDQQIEASSIFQAPWARTTGDESPSRYRLQSQWQITAPSGEQYTINRADEVDGPLTTIDDLLTNVQPKADTQSGRAFLTSSTPPELADFYLEQI